MTNSLSNEIVLAVISTIKKHGMNVYETVVDMLNKPDYIPWEVAGEKVRSWKGNLRFRVKCLPGFLEKSVGVIVPMAPTKRERAAQNFLLVKPFWAKNTPFLR